jgi:tRNA(Ile)-lysidine synthetase-like protein
LNNLVINYIKPGTYILAVSGGVDSVVLLDLLAKQTDLKIIVAHVNHGIRPGSGDDEEFVKRLADNYGLMFVSTKLNLKSDSSEELARNKRYKFLRQQQTIHQAVAIITAHHQDDLIETAFINLIRGTGHWGLSSLNSSNTLIRPLLSFSKNQILQYAQFKNLIWHEDSTNLDKSYLRNKIRHDVVAKMSPKQRQDILEIIKKASNINKAIDKELDILLMRLLHKGRPVLSLKKFRYLPYDISSEVVRKLLMSHGAKEIDRKIISIVTINLKTLMPGKTIQASNIVIELTKRSARIKSNSKTDNK